MSRLASRKLLLHKREIDKLSGRTESKGLTVIPLRIYFRNGIAKVEIALAQGKKIVGPPPGRTRPKKLAGKRNKPCIATGGDNESMQITLDTKPFAALETDALVTYVFEESRPRSGAHRGDR